MNKLYRHLDNGENKKKNKCERKLKTYHTRNWKEEKLTDNPHS